MEQGGPLARGKAGKSVGPDTPSLHGPQSWDAHRGPGSSLRPTDRYGEGVRLGQVRALLGPTQYNSEPGTHPAGEERGEPAGKSLRWVVCGQGWQRWESLAGGTHLPLLCCRSVCDPEGPLAAAARSQVMTSSLRLWPLAKPQALTGLLMVQAPS